MIILCLVLTATRLSDQPIAVIGDAIVPFLDVQDENTAGACLAETPLDVKRIADQSKPWELKRNRWFRAAPLWSWVIFMTL